MPIPTRDILAGQKRGVSNPPRLLKHRSSTWFILSTICIAVFTDVFLYGIIVPVIPFSLTVRCGVEEKDVQHWVSVLLAVYGAALLASSPVCGWLADHSSSRRLPLLFGLLALGGATLLLCLGTCIVLLIIGRLLQGISAAIVWTVGLALLVDTAGQEEIGQVMGYVSISMSVAVLVAPLLGGVVYARGGYYAVYYMAFALIILDIVLRVALVEKKVAKKWIAEDESKEEETSTPPPSASDSEKEKEANPKTSESPIPLPIARLPSTNPPFSPKPSSLPPILTLLSSRRLLSTLYCTLVQSSLLTAWDAIIPLRVSHLFGWHSLGAGLIFLPLVLPSFLAPFIGAYADRHGPRLPTFLGFLLATPFLVLLLLVSHPGIRQIVLMCALLGLLGFALTMVMTPLMAEITYEVAAQEKAQPGKFGPKGAYAQAYGLFNTAFAGGMLVGPLWGGFVTGTAGWGTTCWSLGVWSVVSAVPAVLFTGGWIGERKRKDENQGEGEG
jgi:MFS family permease